MNFQFLLDMSSYFIATLFDYGSGFLFPRLFFDVTALLSLFCFMKSIVIPAIQSYRLALLYDRLCGVEPRHWFYGHMLQVSDGTNYQDEVAELSEGWQNYLRGGRIIKKRNGMIMWEGVVELSGAEVAK